MQKSASSVYRPIAMQFFKDMLETLTEAQRTQAIEFMTYIIFCKYWSPGGATRIGYTCGHH